MKILMCGLGSIGQRHLRNIMRLYGNEHEITAYRVRKLQHTFTDDMQKQDDVSVEEKFHIRTFADLDRALAEKPDAAFITNVTSRHMETALKAAEAGCDIFMEKPLSDSMDGAERLARAVREHGSIVYMGYQNRFHPCMQDMKNMLPEIGRLVNVESEFSERLTTMHTYEDYRTTYMARKELGGGPVLNLQIHVLDYLQWLAGTPVSVYSAAGHSGSLDIDVEDAASSLYMFCGRDGQMLPVYSHTDFFQYPPVHKCKIVGTEGRIEADLNHACTSEFTGGRLKKQVRHEGFERNDMFLAELEDFFRCVRLRIQPETNLEQGITGLRMAVAAKRSAEQNRVIRMEEVR